MSEMEQLMPAMNITVEHLAGSSSSLCLNKSEFIRLLLNKYDKFLLKLSSGEEQ